MRIMNKLSGLLVLVALAAVVGCSSNEKKTPANPTDVVAQEPVAAEAMAAAEQAVPPQPVSPANGAYGTVLDAEGQPVAGVSVMIPELNAKYPVNADGTFTLELEPTGKMLTLIFTASGYQPTEKKISVPPAQPALLSVVLSR